jgi:hypothetical protein
LEPIFDCGSTLSIGAVSAVTESHRAVWSNPVGKQGLLELRVLSPSFSAAIVRGVDDLRFDQIPFSWSPPVPNTSPYTPPAIWQWNKENGGQFANINRPIAGATHDKELQAREVGAGLNRDKTH